MAYNLRSSVDLLLFLAALASNIIVNYGAQPQMADAATIVKRSLAKNEKSPTKENTKPLLVDPKVWDPKFCPRVSKMLTTKGRVIKRMVKLMDQIEKDEKIPETEKKFQISSFEIFRKELVETEEMILQSINWLDRVLKGDYRNILELRESSKARLDALRDATLKEEQEYKDILIAWVGVI